MSTSAELYRELEICRTAVRETFALYTQKLHEETAALSAEVAAQAAAPAAAAEPVAAPEAPAATPRAAACQVAAGEAPRVAGQGCCYSPPDDSGRCPELAH
jgi:hypothetical protein